jgi:DNA-binding CsgD family transcriptional regulator
VAEELSGRRPFGVVADALGINLRAARIGRLLLSAASNDDAIAGDLEFRVTEALLAHVEDLCLEGGVALVLEDLHWADPSTLVFLQRLSRRAGGLPLLVIGTRRPLPEVPPLDRLARDLTERGARQMVLGPLAGDEVQAMARTVLGGPPGPRLLAHLAGASGNPLFVTELVAAADRSGDLVDEPEGGVDLSADAMPSPLSVLVLHRLSLLPPGTLETLRIAAVLGASFSVVDLCRVMALPATEAARLLRPAQVGGVLTDVGDRFRFRHEVIREALYHDTAEPVRRNLHLQVARTLAEADAPAEQVAEQLLRAASPSNPEVADDLRSVAAELAGRAPGLAADALGRAVEVTASPADREELLAERARALWRSGRLEEAEATCRSLLGRRPDPWVRLWLIQILIAQDRLDEAAPVIGEGLTTAEQPAVVRARLLAWAAWARLRTVEGLAEADDAAERAALAAKKAGDRFAHTVALTTRAAVANRRGRFAEAVDLAELALALDSGVGSEGEHFPLYLFQAAFLFDAGRPGEGQLAVKRAFVDCEERGARWELPYCHRLAALGWFLCARWDDALLELEASEALAEELGMRPDAAQACAITAFISLHRSDLPGAAEALAHGDREPTMVGRRDWMLWVRSLVVEASGLPDQALALIWEAWEQCAQADNAAGFALLGPDVVRLCLRAGARARARAESVVATMDELVPRAAAPVVAAAALRCRGLLEGDPGPLLEAARTYEEADRPFEAAQAAEDAGTVLAERGQAGDARERLEEALRHYTASRASYDMGRVEAGLRELGVRRGRQGTRGRPRHGWAALTQTERAVAALVAEGLSNPQVAERLFLSRHTVHTHLSHIFAKLGVTSRVELATEALRQSQ